MRRQQYMPSYYSYEDDGRMSAKEIVQYSLLGIVVVGGAIIIGTRAIQKSRTTSEQRKTLDEGSAATYAKQIKMAFDNDGWWGTDKDGLRAAMRAIPTKAYFRQVMTSYQKLYNSSLLGDMQSELKSTEYNEMLSIIAAKPENSNGKPPQLSLTNYEGWAKRLKAAFDISYGPFPGTDEPAIKAVFTEMPTQADFSKVALVYRNLFGADLIADLKSELEFWEYDDYMQIITGKPKA